MAVLKHLWVWAALAVNARLATCMGQGQSELPYDSPQAIQSNIDKVLAHDGTARKRMVGCEPGIVADLSRQQPSEDGVVLPPLFKPLSRADEAYRVCIVSHFMPNIAYYARDTVENHKSYARTHGYLYQAYHGLIAGGRFLFPDYPLDDPIFRFGIYWQSLAAVEHTMARRLPHTQQPLCERVMWVDADALFTRFDLSVEQVLARWKVEDADVVLNQEMCSNSVNAGVMVLKNSPASRDLLRQVMGMFPRYRHDRTPEQTAINHLVFSNKTHRDTNGTILSSGVALLPQRAMNSLAGREHRRFFKLAEDPDGFWQPGDFLGHFYGPKDLKTSGSRVQWMRDMAAQNWYIPVPP